MAASDPARLCGSRSRREFLAASGKLAAATLATSSLAASSIAGPSIAGPALGSKAVPHVHAAESSTIKLALIGCGGRGTGAVADAFSTTGGPVQLHAMADLFEDRLKGSLNALSGSFKDRVDVPQERQFLGFDAYKKAIDALSPGDVAILTTHAAFRPLQFEYAVRKGVNVFMEKSFATDSPAVRRLLKSAEVAEQKNLKVGVGFMWRHSVARQDVIQRIHDGAIGEVQSLRIYRVHGPVHCPPRPKDQNEVIFQIRHPNSFTWVSSGFFIDWHCHNIDVACWAKGAWPVSAQGMGGRCYVEAGSQFDHYTIEYTYPDGTKLYAFSRHMNGCWETYADYAHGSKGSAVIMSSLAEPKPRIYAGQDMSPEKVVWQRREPDCNPYQAEWQLLLDAIRGDKPHNEVRRACDASIAAIMGRAAAHTGQLVTWEQARDSTFQFVTDIDGLTFETPAPIHDGPDGIYQAAQPGIAKEI